MIETGNNPQQWAQEAKSARQMTFKLLENKHPPLLEEHKSGLFKCAPVLAARNRRIQDKAAATHMAKFAFKRRLDTVRVQGEACCDNEIIFYITYLDAHIVIDELNTSDIESISEILI